MCAKSMRSKTAEGFDETLTSKGKQHDPTSLLYTQNSPIDSKLSSCPLRVRGREVSRKFLLTG